MNNLQIFLNTYKKSLEAAHKADPASYVWLMSEFDEVFERMKMAIIRGTFNKDGASFKLTCKELKIKHTYKAINDFITNGANNAKAST